MFIFKSRAMSLRIPIMPNSTIPSAKVPMASESKEFFIKLCLLSTCFFFINLFLYYPRFSDYPPFRGCKITQKSAVFQKNDF